MMHSNTLTPWTLGYKFQYTLFYAIIVALFVVVKTVLFRFFLAWARYDVRMPPVGITNARPCWLWNCLSFLSTGKRRKYYYKQIFWFNSQSLPLLFFYSVCGQYIKLHARFQWIIPMLIKSISSWSDLTMHSLSSSQQWRLEKSSKKLL